MKRMRSACHRGHHMLAADFCWRARGPPRNGHASDVALGAKGQTAVVEGRRDFKEFEPTRADHRVQAPRSRYRQRIGLAFIVAHVRPEGAGAAAGAASRTAAASREPPTMTRGSHPRS